MRVMYVGTFDPPTNGHVWMIERGVHLFKDLIVGIGVNPAKRSLFSPEERADLLRRSTKHLPSFEIEAFSGQFSVAYARAKGASVLLRGLRNVNDFEGERVMCQVNHDMDPRITTLFLMPPREIVEVSSTMVKELVGPAGWEAIVRRYVPESVFIALKEKHHV